MSKKIGSKEYNVINNKLDMGWVCYWNRETDVEEWEYFETRIQFYNFCTKVFSIAKNKTVWLVAHNIVFDAFINDIWNWLKDKGFETDFVHTKGMVFLQKLKKVKENEKGEKKVGASVMLVNNGNIFPAPLKKIGEAIGIKKKEINFKECTREYEKEYCKVDVTILLEFWRLWTKLIKDYDLGAIKYTVSAQSMEAFKQKFCKHKIYLTDDLELLSFERQAYYGGRTEIFYKGSILKKIKYFDVNSMYPYVMKEFRYPTQHKFTKLNVSVEQMQYYLDQGFLVIAETYVNTKVNCIPHKKDHTLLFPVGKFMSVLATPEIQKGMELGVIEKFGRVEIYQGEKIFSEYIDFFYNLRLKFKSENNPLEKLVKLFLNSLYGKFGARVDKWHKISIEEFQEIVPTFDLTAWIMEEWKLPKILVDGINIVPKIRYIGNELQYSGDFEEDSNSFPAIAAHVTSYAHLILWSALEYCQNSKTCSAFYCDTDSVFTDGDLPSEIVDDKQLGKFKIEKTFDYGVEFINLKNYCPLDENREKQIIDNEGNYHSLSELKNKKTKFKKGKNWTMKGVRADAEIIDENTFLQTEFGGLPRQEYFTKFGRKAGEFWILEKMKENKNIINKGWLDNENVKPFELEEWEM
jgi:hypothetical protein